MNYLRLKRTIICKEIRDYRLDASICQTYVPKAGDTALFEIVELGRHITMQSDSKRNVFLVEGDTIMAAFGNRYASEQWEGHVPAKPTEMLDILAVGGIVGVVKSKHEDLKFIQPTRVRLLGYAVDKNSQVINTKNYAVERLPFMNHVPNQATVILSVGSAMDSGKTTSAGLCARGLKTTGKSVAYLKLTGTTHTKDKDYAYDCGADVALDFSDVGYPSTYLCDKEEILDLYQTLLNMLEPSKPDFIVIEVADGLVQRETDFLLRSKRFTSTIHKVLFSASDSLGVFFGIEYLHKLGLPLVAVSGLFTMSPMLIKEVKANTSVPALTIEQLMSGEYVDLFTPKEEMVNKR